MVNAAATGLRDTGGRAAYAPGTMGAQGRSALALTVLALAAAAGCSGEQAPAAAETITLYTCVSDTTIQPVIEQFQESHPGSAVNLFRAPTGELNARVASDVRSGGLRADVVWACDPLTMQDYLDQDLVGGWLPERAEEIPQHYRTTDYVGIAVLYIVAVHHQDAPAPVSWTDLADPQYAGAVAVPDPSIAASALGALGYFAQDPGHGLEFYADLKENGAVQVSSPTEVTTGVAEGVYEAGITIANSAYPAQESGSPLGVVWPEPGAIAVYGPAAVAGDGADSPTARAFLSYLTSQQGQQVIAAAGSYPSRTDVQGPTVPDDAEIVVPDWSRIAADSDRLLEDYNELFGG